MAFKLSHDCMCCSSCKACCSIARRDSECFEVESGVRHTLRRLFSREGDLSQHHPASVHAYICSPDNVMLLAKL